MFSINAYNFILGQKPSYRLQQDSSWKEISDFTITNPTDMLFKTHYDAEAWLKLNKNEISNKYVKFGDESNMFFEILAHRFSKPHLFTIKELQNVLAQGNDNINNSLIIDFDGYVKLIPTDTDIDFIPYKKYAVRHETYDARNGYVGKVFNDNLFFNLYLNLLDKWLSHLICCRSLYLDCYKNNLNEEHLLFKIHSIYNTLS